MTDSNKMYCSSRIQVVVILFLVTFAAAVAISTPTYEWTDESGMTVMCQKCPPDKCRFCNVICQEGEQVKDKCNSTHNRVCECQPGYHHNGHYCVKDLQCNFQDAVQDEATDEACDKLVIDFILKLNISTATLQRLEFKINNHKGRKPISQRRIRNLLREFKNRDPGLPLLPRLLVFLQEAKISGLEKKLRKKFLLKEES
ncbi:tumor necrosis factor receptor superfamily member 6B isoform X4 [Hyla sarda]|uniref:tumor necrosis factor receptor superfamily member 6B isoform X4 n=1 Tax=Hyla sarda TaxID=327740 RepID=UPI0024C3332E|nr:tumor necrosis factor receptor superfamily member 6B isoform X4 [Hyla sarda]